MTIFLSLLKRYWVPLVLILIIIACVVSIKYYGAGQYKQGKYDALQTVQKEIDADRAKQDKLAKQASADYQALKAAREKQEDIKYVEVAKYIDRPVYLTDCIDDDGMSAVNSAITGN